jgi:hypothetical protein
MDGGENFWMIAYLKCHCGNKNMKSPFSLEDGQALVIVGIILSL